MGQRSIAMSLSVCPLTHLTNRMSILLLLLLITENAHIRLTNFADFGACMYVTCDRCSVLRWRIAICYLLPLVLFVFGQATQYS